MLAIKGDPVEGSVREVRVYSVRFGEWAEEPASKAMHL